MTLGAEESVVERWEFGSAEFCQFAGELGVKLISEANLDLSKYEWGFSATYTHTPDRLLAGREEASWHFMISGGKVSGGAGVPDECRALPGFQLVAPWAAIAHASSLVYGKEGVRKRIADEAVFRAKLAELDPSVKDPEKPPEAAEKKALRCVACKSPDHEYADCRVWPPGIGEALSVDAEHGGGLHNIEAKHIKPSAELAGLPMSQWGFPLVPKMTDEQKVRFLKLLGDIPAAIAGPYGQPRLADRS
jgi:hypothetical protein